MSKIISLSNHKGGVGKTTSAINLGAGLQGIYKKNVLLVDFDPQANLSQSLGINNSTRTIYGALRGDYPLEPIHKNGLDVIASTLDLSGAEVELSSETGREYILKELLEPLRDQYDFIFIDTPPSLGLLTVNALTASDQILIPLQAQYLALQGLTKLLEVVVKIQKRLNKGLQFGGVFITQYDGRKILNRDVLTTIETHFKNDIFKTKIRDNVALAEAPTQGVDIFSYSPKSYGAEDYASLCEELINRVNTVNRVNND